MIDAMMAAIESPAPQEAVDAKPDSGNRGAADNGGDGGDAPTAVPEDGDKDNSLDEPRAKEERKPKVRIGDREVDISPDDVRELAKSLKWKVKVDGKVDEVTQDKLIKSYQLEQASQKRMQEAAGYKKHSETLQNLMQSGREDPKTIFKLAELLGHDPVKLAEDLLFERFEYERMTPEQRRLMELEHKLEGLTSQREQPRQEELKETEPDADAQEQLALSGIDEELSALFDEMQGKLDRDDVTLIANLLQNAYESGQDLSAKDAHKEVQALFERKFQARLRGLTADDLKALIPSELLKQMRADDVALAQSKVDPLRRKRAQQTESPEGLSNRKPTDKKRPTFDELFKEMGV